MWLDLYFRKNIVRGREEDGSLRWRVEMVEVGEGLYRGGFSEMIG